MTTDEMDVDVTVDGEVFVEEFDEGEEPDEQWLTALSLLEDCIAMFALLESEELRTLLSKATYRRFLKTDQLVTNFLNDIAEGEAEDTAVGGV